MSTPPLSPKDDAPLTEQIGDSIRTLLRKISFDPKKASPLIFRDKELVHRVLEFFSSQGYTPEELRPCLRLLDLSRLAVASYPYHSLDVQIYIAIYTILFFAVDDLASTESFVQLLRPFTQVFARRRLHGHSVLEMFDNFILEETPKFFGPYATSAIIGSSLDFVNSCALEFQIRDGLANLTPGTPKWLRERSGNSVAFVHMLFPEKQFPEEECLGKYIQAVPGVTEITDRVNDVMSFYKEMCDEEERAGYLMLQAQVENRSIGEIFETSCEQIAVMNQAVRRSLSSDTNELGRYYETFITHYVAFHLNQKRYRLGELGF